MAYDTRLPLMGTGPDVLGSYVSGVSAAEKVQDMRRKKGLRDLFSEQGGAIMRGESGALEKLAQYDPQSAMGIQSTLASERRAQSQEGRAQGAYNLRMSEAERVQNQQKLQRAVSVMQGINDPAAWDAAAQQYDPAMVGRFAEKDNIINEALGLSAALERTAAQQGAAAASGYFGGADEFNAGLAQTESGGRYDIVNDEGYTGKYQFGQARLDDYNRAKGTSYTTEQLRTNPELQEGVQSWHVGDIDNYIQSNGLDQYVGRNVGGVNMSVDGMRAMAHLGGKAGMKKFLESGGEYNPADSNGTRLSDYAQTHGSKAEDPTQRLATLLQNPDVSPDVKRLAVADYERSVAQPKGPDWRVATPEEAAKYGAQAGQINDKTGKFEKVSPPSGMSLETSADGTVKLVQGAGVTGSIPKLTESQGKATGFYGRAASSQEILNSMEKQGTELYNRTVNNIPIAGNYLVSEEFQQYDQAKRDFINAILRQESGAVIADSEFANAEKQYFPQPGDKASVIDQKRKNRENAIRGIEIASGQGAGAFEQSSGLNLDSVSKMPFNDLLMIDVNEIEKLDTETLEAYVNRLESGQ